MTMIVTADKSYHSNSHDKEKHLIHLYNGQRIPDSYDLECTIEIYRPNWPAIEGYSILDQHVDLFKSVFDVENKRISGDEIMTVLDEMKKESLDGVKFGG